MLSYYKGVIKVTCKLFVSRLRIRFETGYLSGIEKQNAIAECLTDSRGMLAMMHFNNKYKDGAIPKQHRHLFKVNENKVLNYF